MHCTWPLRPGMKVSCCTPIPHNHDLKRATYFEGARVSGLYYDILVVCMKIDC